MKHNNNFDGVRLIGAMMVLVSHTFALTGRHEPIVAGMYSLGTLGVLIFFSISGFLVASSWERQPQLLPFAAKRLLRIWPGLAFVVLVTAVVGIAFEPASGLAATRHVLRNMLFLRDGWAYFGANPHQLMNGPLWTIPIEVFCYAAFAVIAIAAGSYKRAALIVVLAGGVLYMLPFSERMIRYLTRASGDASYVPWMCLFFAVGALAYLSKPRGAFAIASVVVGVAALVEGHVSLGLLFLVPPVALTVGLQSWPPLNQAARFGDMSYGIYLWAWPVTQVSVVLLGKDAPLWQHLVLITITTVALAYGLWHLVEKKALRMKPAARIRPDVVGSTARAAL